MENSVIGFYLPEFKVTKEQVVSAIKFGLLWFHEQGFEGNNILIKDNGNFYPGYVFLPIEPETYNRLVKDFGQTINAYWKTLDESKSDL